MQGSRASLAVAQQRHSGWSRGIQATSPSVLTLVQSADQLAFLPAEFIQVWLQAVPPQGDLLPPCSVRLGGRLDKRRGLWGLDSGVL
jgi:hypothetical protein